MTENQRTEEMDATVCTHDQFSGPQMLVKSCKEVMGVQVKRTLTHGVRQRLDMQA